jgi:hypothetical protein
VNRTHLIFRMILKNNFSRAIENSEALLGGALPRRQRCQGHPAALDGPDSFNAVQGPERTAEPPPVMAVCANLATLPAIHSRKGCGRFFWSTGAECRKRSNHERVPSAPALDPRLSCETIAP